MGGGDRVDIVVVGQMATLSTEKHWGEVSFLKQCPHYNSPRDTKIKFNFHALSQISEYFHNRSFKLQEPIDEVNSNWLPSYVSRVLGIPSVPWDKRHQEFSKILYMM